jgi:hypothetical protein
MRRRLPEFFSSI